MNLKKTGNTYRYENQRGSSELRHRKSEERTRGKRVEGLTQPSFLEETRAQSEDRSLEIGQGRSQRLDQAGF